MQLGVTGKSSLKAKGSCDDVNGLKVCKRCAKTQFGGMGNGTYRAIRIKITLNATILVTISILISAYYVLLRKMQNRGFGKTTNRAIRVNIILVLWGFRAPIPKGLMTKSPYIAHKPKEFLSFWSLIRRKSFSN